ncbi:General substrate transporter [Akanthomyces lecanii RCEF 1005]|uniref:General substrate transporter n=1 Tax=Akanthomyces lecanii RCEF 1005 TaxID=1081108 RepID=A0A162JEL4_CORDF|nr:General substrate transporter [Akanthomyces lecanii RCEF 1005]
METEKKPVAGVPESIEGLTLKDATPRLEKIWIRYPRLLQLNFLLLCAFLGQTATGYDGSMLNGMQALPQWEKYFGSPSGGKLGAMVNGIVFGVLIALPFSSLLCERLGRRYPIIIGTSIIIVGSSLQTAAVNYSMFVVGRFLIGFGGGLVAVASPQLMMECAYPSHRGKLVSLYMTQWPVGYLIAAWVTYGTFKIQSEWSWRLPSLLQVVPSLIQLVLSFFAPESPRWLIYQNRTSEAIDMLAKYHADGDHNSLLVRVQVAEIELALAQEKQQKAMKWSEFVRTPGNRRRLLILIFVGYATQWSGNGLTAYYLPRVLDSVHITAPKTQLLINALIAVFKVCCSLACALSIDRVGRRGLILFGTTVMFVVFVIWTITSALNQERNFEDKRLASAVVAMIFLFHVGYQPLGAAAIVYVIESAPFSLRAKTAMIFQFCAYTASVFNNFVNPIAMDAIQWRYYMVYVAILVAEVIITYFFLPETKGRSLEEIAEIFDGPEAAVRGSDMTKGEKVSCSIKE